MNSEIRSMEQHLRAAMLASNVAELDALIDDRLVFVGPDSKVYRKEDDLALHRSGQQTLSRLDLKEVQIEMHGATAVTVVLADLAGVFKGQAFEGSFRYLRTWQRFGEAWRIVAGSVCAVV